MEESHIPYIKAKAIEFREQLNKVVGTSPTMPESAFEGMFSSALEQVYASRDAFLSTSQSALNSLLLFFTAGATLLLFLLTSDHPPGLVQIIGTGALAAICFGTPMFLRKNWKDKVDAGYDLYAASVIHATVIVRALGLPLTHHWLELVENCFNAKGVFSEAGHSNRLIFKPCDCQAAVAPELDSAQKIIAVWRSRRPNLFWFYDDIFTKWTVVAGIIGVGACAGLICLSLSNPALVFPTSQEPKMTEQRQEFEPTLPPPEKADQKPATTQPELPSAQPQSF